MRKALLIGTLLALLAASGARAAVHLDPIGTFNSPTYVTSFPNDPDRLLVTEQAGTIQLVDHGVASLFLDLKSAGLIKTGLERGLLSVAIAPDYATTHHLYAFYTRATDAAVEVDEFTADGDSVPLSSRRRVLLIQHPGLYENGGQLVFGPDGYLYVTVGDNGVPENGQDLGTLLGKVLRIDPRRSGSQPYTIPPDNPFAGGPHPEIWAYGVRNPWRLTFDRATGALLTGEVGEFTREEVDYFPGPSPARGANLGWACREGSIPFRYAPASCEGAGPFVEPIYDFGHPANGCAAIVGGYVVRDPSLGDLDGRYLFTDTCDGRIRSLVPQLPAATDVRSEGLSVNRPSSFGEDSCGRLYIASLGSGEVSRFEGDAPASCAAPGGGGGGGGGQTPPSCGGKRATRVSGSGRSIKGSPGDDVIVADSRNNKIHAGRGDDIICAKGGRDKIHAGPGADRIKAGPGKDECFGGNGKDHLKSC